MKQVIAGKGMPKPLFTHVFHSSPILIHVGLSLTQRKLIELSPSRFSCRFFISPCPKKNFGFVEGMSSIHSRFGGFKRSFLFPSHNWSLLCVSLMIFYIFLIVLQDGNLFLVMLSGWEDRSVILGFIAAIFSPVMSMSVS